MYQFPLAQCEVEGFSGQITSYSGVRALPTVGLQIPCTQTWSISDDDETWKLRARASGENDDGKSFLVPNDYNATTNNVIWVRVQ